MAGCNCGCGTMPMVTNADQACGCGCECCGAAQLSRDDEIRQLEELLESTERRLTELKQA